MSADVQHIYTDQSPGMFRAVAATADGRALRIFSEHWSGNGERARYGALYDARLRAFADPLRGAFCELSSGEEVFLRLKSRDGLTEGMTLGVKVLSETRRDKLARVVISDQVVDTTSAFQAWKTGLAGHQERVERADREFVDAAFEEALSPSITLPGGGQMHIDRTRALTAIDIDTAGRVGKGSAAARALSINREAVSELARQISLRGLGGLFVLDCISPLTAEAITRIRDDAKGAFAEHGFVDARILKPSPLGLLEASVPWRNMPVEDKLAAKPEETELLDLLRDLQRDAIASPVKFYKLSLCGPAWQAYLSRKSETDQALHEEFGGRVSIVESATQENKVSVQ